MTLHINEMQKDQLYKVALTFIFTTIAANTLAYSFDGPLQARNQFPLFIHLNQPVMEKATLENSWSISLSTSTTHQVHDSKYWSMGLDLEMTGLDFRARKIIFNSLELGADIPFLSVNSGFLDAPLNNYHKAFGFRDYGRSLRPENDFLYEVKRKGATIVKGEVGSSGISDIRLSAKKALVSHNQTVSFKMSLELPTGNAKKGYGSGNYGTDSTFMLDKKISERLMAYSSIGIAFPGDLAGYETVEIKQFLFGGIAFEAAAGKNLNILSQLTFQESPYPKTGIREVDDIAILFTLGARYASQGGSYEFTFSEDPDTAGAPDFSVGLSYKKNY